MIGSLQIYRVDQPHLLVNIDENTFFSQVVMGEHLIASSFISNEPLDVDEGDYVILGGERFSINKTLPPVTKSAINELSYNLQFQGYIYDLHYCAYRHLGSSEFELFATADVFIGIIVGCLNNIYTGWSAGQIDVTEPKLIQFFENGKGFSCKGAILKIAEAFGLEFWLTGKTLNLTAQAGVDTNITFEYGRGRGLYEIVRGEIDNELYFNRLYVEGSTRNIPVGYRGGMKRLQIDVPYLQLEIPAGKRIRETSVVIENIFPKRVGTITAVSADQLTITDASIDFDLNGNKIEGQEQTVEMLTGENSGQSFDIDKYNHATKSIIILPKVDKTGEARPNATFEIKPGDQYFFAGIKIPDAYIAAAEVELKAEGVKLVQKAAKYVPPYSVRVSDKFMRDNGLKINAGDRVRLKDAALGIDVKIRVSAVKFSLVDPYTVELLISDVIPYTSEDKNIIEIGKAKKETVVVNKVNAEKARRNMLDIRRLQQNVFDPDGYFDPENIKPNSIETLMLSVGAKSQNFGLNNVSINANTNGDPNFVTVSQGALIHYEIQIEGLGYVWQMGAAEFPVLDPTKTYFLSAKCRTTALTGEWVLSETPIKTEVETGYYHFYVGLFYPVTQGSRGYDLTNGMTFIVGDRITTGRIQSLDGLSFFDLSQNKFNVGDLLSGLDWDVTTAGQLTIRGNIVATNATFIGLVVQNIRTGKVRITADANNIRLVDEVTNKIILLLDDDSAYEGEYLSLTPPITSPSGSPDPNYLGSVVRQVNGADVLHYKYARRGPGMTSGTPGEAATSLGRGGVVTTDINGIIKQRKQVDLITGKGWVRDNVFDGLYFDEIINKTTGTKQSAQFKLETINGKTYVVADDIQPVEDRIYNPYVVADSGDGNGGTYVPVEPPTEPTTLREKFDFPIGSAIKKPVWEEPRAAYRSIGITQFDRWSPENEMKMGRIVKVDGNGNIYYDWSDPDWFMDTCKANGKKAMIHCVIWANEISDAVYAVLSAMTEQQRADWLFAFVVMYFERYVVNPTYAGVATMIDLINEPFDTAGNIKASKWKTLLPNFHIVALTAAQPYKDMIKIGINDFDYEYGNNKAAGLITFRDAMAALGLTFHYIGSQMHSVVRMSVGSFRTRLQMLSDAGIMVHISELDVLLRQGMDDDPDTLLWTGSTPTDLFNTRTDLQDLHKNFFLAVFQGYIECVAPAMRLGITTWSIGFRENAVNADGSFSDFPVLWDYTYTPTPAYNAILSTNFLPYPTQL